MVKNLLGDDDITIPFRDGMFLSDPSLDRFKKAVVKKCEFLFKIFYYVDIFGKFFYHHHTKDRKIDLTYLNQTPYYDIFLHYYSDIIKENIMREFKNKRKVNVDIRFYDQNDRKHEFLVEIQKIINPKSIEKCNIHSVLFILVYDEKDLLYFAGGIDLTLCCKKNSKLKMD